MLRLIILMVVLMLSQSVAAAEEKELALHERQRAENLAALKFRDVQSITAVALRDDKGMPRIFVEAPPKNTLRKAEIPRVLAAISELGNYDFNGTAMCFDPGFRIEIREKTRVVKLDVCLMCDKMEVTIDAAEPFIMDFSTAGLVAYKVLYVDLMVLTELFSERPR